MWFAITRGNRGFKFFQFPCFCVRSGLWASLNTPPQKDCVLQLFNFFSCNSPLLPGSPVVDNHTIFLIPISRYRLKNYFPQRFLLRCSRKFSLGKLKLSILLTLSSFWKSSSIFPGHSKLNSIKSLQVSSRHTTMGIPIYPWILITYVITDNNSPTVVDNDLGFLSSRPSLLLFMRYFCKLKMHIFMIYNPMLYKIFSKFLSNRHYLTWQYFISQKIKIHSVAISKTSKFLPLSWPHQPLIYFLSIQICLYCSYKWNHAMCDHLCSAPYI